MRTSLECGLRDNSNPNSGGKMINIKINDDTNDATADLYISDGEECLAFNFQSADAATNFQHDFEALLARHRINCFLTQLAAERGIAS